jgi:hypothetical protein
LRVAHLAHETLEGWLGRPDELRFRILKAVFEFPHHAEEGRRALAIKSLNVRLAVHRVLAETAEK